MKKIIFMIIVFCILVLSLTGCGKKELKADLTKHDNIKIWGEEIPYHNKNDVTTSIIPYLAEGEGKHPAVVLCPGGGYLKVADGKDIAEAFNEKGISVFILQYRLTPSDYRGIFSDVLRAVRFVRYYANEFEIDENKVGISGFSAGGHLALMCMEKFDEKVDITDNIDKESARPDFGILGETVVSMKEGMTHEKSKANFFGDYKDDDKLAKQFSGDENVREDMPPFFIWHCRTDTVAPVKATEALIAACKEKGVSCTSKIYEKGKHGLGLAKGMKEIEGWFDLCSEWMEDQQIIE